MNKKIHIFATTDVHGHLYKTINNTELSGKISSLAPFLASYPKEEYLLIDNGDWFLGNPFTTFLANKITSEVNPLVDVLNYLNYDAVICGNHDLDYGIEFLTGLTKRFNGSFLSANIVNKDLQPIFEPYTIIEKNGIKVGIFGLTTAALRQIQSFDNVKETYALDTIETTKKYIADLRKKVDILLVSYHGGIERNMETGAFTQYDTKEDEAYRIISSFSEIDAVICGHQHFINQGFSCDKPYIQPGTAGNILGEISFEVDENNKIISNQTKTNLHTLSETSGDANFSKIIYPYINKYQQWFKQTFTYKKMLKHIHQTMQEIVGVDISCCNQLREITPEHIYDYFKPPYTVKKISLPKAEFESIINQNRDIFNLYSFENVTFNQLNNQITIQTPILERYDIVVNNTCTLFPSYTVATNYIDNAFDIIIKTYEKSV